MIGNKKGKTRPLNEGLATEETLQAAIAPSGTDTDFSVTLTSAVTAYALFAAPASAYELTIYNGSDTDIYIRKTIGTPWAFFFRQAE